MVITLYDKDLEVTLIKCPPCRELTSIIKQH